MEIDKYTNKKVLNDTSVLKAGTAVNTIGIRCPRKKDLIIIIIIPGKVI